MNELNQNIKNNDTGAELRKIELFNSIMGMEPAVDGIGYSEVKSNGGTY
ncbi:MAG: hypothetical protein LR001_01215 [Clostridiales bacterium]|nr:hypothetical protein [Clostridiales bacterium]